PMVVSARACVPKPIPAESIAKTVNFLIEQVLFVVLYYVCREQRLLDLFVQKSTCTVSENVYSEV
ncbi:hypothetical protein, partial [Vibrio cholerae]|uniref:hypothetical protein n=1 Tax=Vibrio cholerae TaxID=666 RepID=UPI001968ADD3